MSKEQEQGVKELAAVMESATKSVADAVGIADKYGLEFDICGQTYIGDNGQRLTLEDYWDGTYYDDLDEDDERYDEEQLYAGWQNSSTFC